MTTDDWVQSALTDDSVVVELLFKLKQTSPMLPPPGWGHRHPRSKSGSSTKKKEQRESTRFSPTTPLSWSGGGGASVSISDYEEFTHRYRSKGIFANESQTAATNNKRPKKKTYRELKEEESLLSKEQSHLKKELASLRSSLKKERDRSESLKRIKLDCQQLKPSFDHNRPILERLGTSSSSSSPSAKQQIKVESKPCFVLPDLNMPLSEDDSTR